MTKENIPQTMSLCVIALNEEAFLPALLENIRAQEYPHDLMEVVLVDSGSVDGTRKIMEDFRASEYGFSRVTVVDNPGKSQPAGWNVAIAASQGDVIARVDAHSVIPPEYSRILMEDLQAGEDVAGGKAARISCDESPWSRVLLEVENALFGCGISTSRLICRKQYASSLSFPVYRRSVFEKVGLFNETLVRTEDNEIHYRMRRAGYRLLMDPRVKVSLYARNSFPSMLRQKHQNGYWIGRTSLVCPRCLSPWHFAPVVFVVAVIVSAMLAICGVWQAAALLWVAYGGVVFLSTMRCIISDGFFSFLQLLLPVLFLSLHSVYGVGTLHGILDALRSGGKKENQ